MSNNELMCWHHPNRKATQISNLGTVLDLDTLVCDRCAARILADKNQNQPINPNATERHGKAAVIDWLRRLHWNRFGNTEPTEQTLTLYAKIEGVNISAVIW